VRADHYASFVDDFIAENDPDAVGTDPPGGDDGTGEQAAHDAGARVVVAAAHRMPCGVEHVHDVAGRPGAANVRDLAAVDPGMAGAEPAIAAPLEDELGRGPTSSAARPP
jgi:hypothetical protein